MLLPPGARATSQSPTAAPSAMRRRRKSPGASVSAPRRAQIAGAQLEQAGFPVDHVIPGSIELCRVSGVDLDVPILALGIRADGLDPPLRERDAGELQSSSLQDDIAAIPEQHGAMAGVLKNDRDILGVDRGVAPAGQFDAVAARGGQCVRSPRNRQVAGAVVVGCQDGRRQCGRLRGIAKGGRSFRQDARGRLGANRLGENNLWFGCPACPCSRDGRTTKTRR